MDEASLKLVLDALPAGASVFLPLTAAEAVTGASDERDVEARLTAVADGSACDLRAREHDPWRVALGGDTERGFSLRKRDGYRVGA